MTQHYLVPEGMHRACLERMRKFKDGNEHRWVDNPSAPGTDRKCIDCGAIDCSSSGDYECTGFPSSDVQLILEEALRWEDDNFPKPRRLDNEPAGIREAYQMGYDDTIEDLRRMYIAPEPEIKSCPAESVLRMARVVISNDWLCPYCEGVHEAILSTEKEVNRVDCYYKTPEGEYKPWPTTFQCGTGEMGTLYWSPCSKCGKNHLSGESCVAPEPGVPKEIKDLLFDGDGEDRKLYVRTVNSCLIEAFRRGQVQK